MLGGHDCLPPHCCQAWVGRRGRAGSAQGSPAAILLYRRGAETNSCLPATQPPSYPATQPPSESESPAPPAAAAGSWHKQATHRNALLARLALVVPLVRALAGRVQAAAEAGPLVVHAGRAGGAVGLAAALPPVVHLEVAVGPAWRPVDSFDARRDLPASLPAPILVGFGCKWCTTSPAPRSPPPEALHHGGRLLKHGRLLALGRRRLHRQALPEPLVLAQAAGAGGTAGLGPLGVGAGAARRAGALAAALLVERRRAGAGQALPEVAGLALAGGAHVAAHACAGPRGGGCGGWLRGAAGLGGAHPRSVTPGRLVQEAGPWLRQEVAAEG
jgi:hypothetical protein